MTSSEVLKQYFGYHTFREGQAEIIDALVSGRDALGIMPTGAGKSLCYQVPALCLPGVTLVVSPLISLMRDQVQALVASGVPAAFINSSLTDSQYARAMDNILAGRYKIIYIAPERLLMQSMQEMAEKLTISLIAVDEAHCISQWGQDFRPSYLDIPKFIANLPVYPCVAAFTATATPRVREDILQKLQLKAPLVVTTGFDRPNLYFEVQCPKDKYMALSTFLRGHEGNGIVYCSTRKEVENVAGKLIADGYAAVGYHAGLSDAARSRAQDDFIYDKIRIIVATNAFGMGIDKSDVRFVVHYNMPMNIESYYQEAGRAGRDGLLADCLLLYARKDINTALFLISQSENETEKIRNRQLMNQMEQYCETDGCLRRFLLQYFGEPVQDDCGNCGNCNGDFIEMDATEDAQKLLSTIGRINNQHRAFGFGAICKVLQGKPDAYIKARNLDEIATFGAMRDAREPYIRRLFDKLVAQGYISLSNDNYRTASLTPQARQILFDGVAVTVRADKSTSDKRLKGDILSPSKRKSIPRAISEDLLAKLKALRLTIAKEDNVPAFVVFSDATLVDTCQKHPRTEEEFLQVSGVGQVKLSRYGERFLAVLRAEEAAPEPSDPLPAISAERLRELVEISDEPLPISRVADNLNVVFLRYEYKKTSGMALNKLLLERGYLKIIDGEKMPTEKGCGVGITTIECHNERGRYAQCLFGAEAQRAIVAMATAIEIP